MVDFHGWMLPVQYEGILAEHNHCRSSACLFDTSHMGQLIIAAPEPAAISRVTTQDAEALAVGQGKYGFLLNDDGGIIDDTILMRLSDSRFMLVVNAATAAGDFRWVSEHLAGAAQVTDQSAAGWGKIDLQGPAAAKALGPQTDVDLGRLGYFRVTQGKVCGADSILSRTGYTGELGYEIYAPSESIERIFELLAADPLVAPAGLGARDSLRLEMCYPLHGQDIGPEVDPLTAGLGDFVKARHDYIGAAAIGRIVAAGPQQKLVAFVVAGRRRAETGNEILCGGQAVGQVTSGAFSPSLNVSIGMGYVPADLAQVGREITIRTARAELHATLAQRPIYKQGTCRIKDI